MFGHLPEEALMDVVDGTAAPSARAHVEGCPSCRTRVAEAAAIWALVQEAVVPEPSPLYWEAFRRQVDRRIQGEGRRSHWLRLLVPLAAAAGLVLALPHGNGPAPVPSPSASASLLPSWSALPPADDDPGLDVLKAVASSDSDLSSSYERGNIQELLSDLSDEESQALAERLKTEGSSAGAL